MPDRANEPVNDDRTLDMVHRYLDGTLDAEQIEQLQVELAANPQAIAELVQSAAMDEMLASHFQRHGEEAVQKEVLSLLRIGSGRVANTAATTVVADRGDGAWMIRGLRNRTWLLGSLIAATLLVAATVYLRQPRDVAMVTRLVDVQMAKTSTAYLGMRLKDGDRLDVAQGQVEITFDRGTVVALKGPADFEIVSDMRAKSRDGRITVDVGPRAIGFTVETPSANIVDWGTKFGVGVEGQATDVIVFDGVVDLHARSAQGSLGEATRLTQGEALRVSSSGEFHRIVSINDTEFPTPHGGNIASTAAPIISKVTDNVRDGTTNKYYRVVHGGLRDDSVAYVDRSHQWNGMTADGLPRFLVGADYVMPFNEDKRIPGLRIAVTFARDANVYVFYDSKMPAPQWLTSRFEDTGVDIGLDEGPSTSLPEWTTGVGGGVSVDTHFRVWKCVVSEGERLVLGPRAVDDQLATGPRAMYAIAATPLDH